MNQKTLFKTATLVLFAVLTFLLAAGCSLISGSSPTATIRNYHLRAESNNPEAMTKLFSTAYLQKNKKALENSRSFADLVQKAVAAGDSPSLFDLSETFVGEKAIVKGRYGSRKSGSLPFQARLVKENGEWKIEAFGDHDADLTKEEPPIEFSKEFVRELEADDGRLRGVTFSPDGKTLALTVEKNEAGKTKSFIQLLDVESGNVKSKTPVEAKFSIHSFQFSPDGKMFACANDEKNIYIWNSANAAQPKQMITFNEADKYEEPVSLAFAPDGGSLYAAGTKGGLLIYDANTGKLKQKLEGHPPSAAAKPAEAKSNIPPPPAGSGLHTTNIVFSNDGKMFATVAQPEVKIWNAQTGKAIQKLLLPAEVINGVTQVDGIYIAFAPDGKSLLSYSRGRLLQRWNIQTGEPAAIKEIEKAYVGSAEFSPDGKLMSDSGGKSEEPPRGVRIYEAQTGELKAAFTGHRGHPQAIFSPDGKLVASTSDKDYNKIFLWDISGISR